MIGYDKHKKSLPILSAFSALSAVSYNTVLRKSYVLYLPCLKGWLNRKWRIEVNSAPRSFFHNINQEVYFERINSPRLRLGESTRRDLWRYTHSAPRSTKHRGEKRHRRSGFHQNRSGLRRTRRRGWCVGLRVKFNFERRGGRPRDRTSGADRAVERTDQTYGCAVRQTDERTGHIPHTG